MLAPRADASDSACAVTRYSTLTGSCFSAGQGHRRHCVDGGPRTEVRSSRLECSLVIPHRFMTPCFPGTSLSLFCFFVFDESFFHRSSACVCECLCSYFTRLRPSTTSAMPLLIDRPSDLEFPIEVCACCWVEALMDSDAFERHYIFFIDS